MPVLYGDDFQSELINHPHGFKINLQFTKDGNQVIFNYVAAYSRLVKRCFGPSSDWSTWKASN